MGNAHAWRHRNGYGKPCSPDCLHCKLRPKSGEPGKRRKNYKNKTSAGRHCPKGRAAQRKKN